MNDWVAEGRRRSRGKAVAEKKHFLVQVCFEREQWLVSFSQNVLCYCRFFVCRRQEITSWQRSFFPRLLCTLKSYPSGPTLPSFNPWDWGSDFLPQAAFVTSGSQGIADSNEKWLAQDGRECHTPQMNCVSVGIKQSRNAAWAHCPALHPSEMLTYASQGEMDQQMVHNPFSTKTIIYIS